MASEFSFTAFFGRFHPVLVHLPIGIILLAFLFEILSRSKRYKRLRAAVKPALFYGSLSAFLAAGSGYYLSQEGGYDAELLVRHEWMGFLTAGLSLLVYLFKRNTFSLEKEDRKMAVLVLFFPLAFLLTITGHLGGSLTHGENYLFEHVPGQPKSNSTSAIPNRLTVADIKDAQVYRDVIKPVLETRCYSCHGSKKQKGQLRLDEPEYILKGGKDGKVLVARNSGESELFKRISLSVEEKHHMPPRKERQLHAAEIELIRWWIDEGAAFDQKVGGLVLNPELDSYFKSLMNGSPSQSWVPERPVAPADEAVVRNFRSTGVSVVSVAAQSNYLAVSFAGRRNFSAADLELLKALAPQLIDLNLAWTSVSDSEMKLISSLGEIRRLSLDHTHVTDAGVASLAQAQNLVYLNLVSTKVTDQSLKTISSLPTLEELFVFDTSVTRDGLKQLGQKVKVDTGHYQLPKLITDTLVHKVR